VETRQPDLAAGGSLFALPGSHGSPRCLYPANGVTEVAASGGQVLALEMDSQGKSGALVDLPRAGGAPQRRVGDLARPQGLIADRGDAYWTEFLPSGAPQLWHIPVLGPKVLVRSSPIAGKARQRLIAITEGPEAGFRGKLLGVIGERFYWIGDVGGGDGTEWSVLRDVPLAGGTVEDVRSDLGRQTACSIAGHCTTPLPPKTRAIRSHSAVSGAPHRRRPLR